VKNLLALLVIGIPLGAFGQPAAVQECSACHGARGEGNASKEAAPRIAGQPQAYLERQLAAYADGRRKNPVMTPIAKQLSGDQRSELTAYYSKLRAPAAKSAKASVSASARGRTLATRGDGRLNVQGCANCHGPGGTGFGNVNPYLAGLDRAYLETALGEWRSGSRRTDPSEQMNQIARNLGAADIKALAQHYSSQPPPQPAMARVTKPRTGGEPSGSQGPGGAGTK
jgi:cytochrome c553